MKKRRFFAGRSLAQVVVQAATYYGLDPEELAYRELDKRTGFVHRRRRLVIEVDPSAPRAAVRTSLPSEAVGNREGTGGRPAEPGAAARELERGAAHRASPRHTHGSPQRTTPRRGPSAAPPRPPADPLEGREGKTLEMAVELLLAFAKVEVEAELGRRDEVVEIELQGEGSRRLTARRARGLRAVEALVPRVAAGLGLPLERVRVDADGYEARRLARLAEYAREAAREACERGEAIALDPMRPRERRIVHQVLADVEGVTTESEGHGFDRRVRVVPT